MTVLIVSFLFFLFLIRNPKIYTKVHYLLERSFLQVLIEVNLIIVSGFFINFAPNSV